MSYGYLDLALEVLKDVKEPMTFQELWELAATNGLTNKIKTSGKTPWQSFGARLYVDVRDNPNSQILKVGQQPTRFFLKSREPELPKDIDAILKRDDAKVEKDASNKSGSQAAFRERDLHPLLAYFAGSNPSFNRGRPIYTKTIFHEQSNKSGYNEWLHPDMVGFYMPLDDWEPDVVEFNKLADNNALRLYSFELKKSLTKGNYRESYFQAVSNSSWAHEGYLVAAQVLNDEEFLAELGRLATAHGIGIIQLDPRDIDSSRTLFPAKTKEFLDWEMMNKLCAQNPNFKKFLHDVQIDFTSKRIMRTEYDAIDMEISAYIRSRLKIETAE